MNILLLNYNYYPFAWGGSEVYVHGWAKYLVGCGHQVTVLAAIPKEKQQAIVYEDTHLQINTYEYEGIRVIGVSLQAERAEEIYSRYNAKWVDSWASFFGSMEALWNLDWVHYNGYTGVVSTAVVEGLWQVQMAKGNCKAQVLGSYHTPISCPNGKLLYFGHTACQITPSAYHCTACFLCTNHHVATPTAHLIGYLLPMLSQEKLPTVLRLKKFIQECLVSFQRLDQITTHWVVMSQQIAAVIQKMGVSTTKISMLRHGIHQDFLQEQPYQKPVQQTVFAYLGRFEKIKGIHTLLKAWLAMPVATDKVLWVIGALQSDNTAIQSLVAQAQQRTDIQFLGSLPMEAIREILLDVHCVIIPSECLEIGPLVLHEAVACGANIIASDIGGTQELAAYYGEGCTVFRQGNVTDLQQKILDFHYLPIKHKVMSQEEHYKSLLALIQSKN